jgi:hypothetical protein
MPVASFWFTDAGDYVHFVNTPLLGAVVEVERKPGNLETNEALPQTGEHVVVNIDRFRPV